METKKVVQYAVATTVALTTMNVVTEVLSAVLPYNTGKLLKVINYIGKTVIVAMAAEATTEYIDKKVAAILETDKVVGFYFRQDLLDETKA